MVQWSVGNWYWYTLPTSEKCTVAQCTCWADYTLGSAPLFSFRRTISVFGEERM